MPNGKKILMDKGAASKTAGAPGFLSRPEGAPVYHGFPLVKESLTDGWCLGVITAFENPEGCEEGDAFVVAPDGSRAGLVWTVGDFPVREILPPTEGRWGVYEVPFPKPVRTLDDIVECFRSVLPELRNIYDRLRPAGKGKLAS